MTVARQYCAVLPGSHRFRAGCRPRRRRGRFAQLSVRVASRGGIPPPRMAGCLLKGEAHVLGTADDGDRDTRHHFVGVLRSRQIHETTGPEPCQLLRDAGASGTCERRGAPGDSRCDPRFLRQSRCQFRSRWLFRASRHGAPSAGVNVHLCRFCRSDGLPVGVSPAHGQDSKRREEPGPPSCVDQPGGSASSAREGCGGARSVRPP